MNDRSIRLFAVCKLYGFVTSHRESAVEFLYWKLDVPTRVFLSCVTDADCKKLLRKLSKNEKYYC